MMQMLTRHNYEGCGHQQLCCSVGVIPDIRGDTLVRVVNHGARLYLVEGGVAEVVLSQLPCHVVPPLQRQAGLQGGSEMFDKVP